MRMAIIVVGGGGRGAGKTALVCGLMRALPEIPWTAVKITSHEHGHRAKPIFEETAPGQGTDTARYLAAGARRALLVTAVKMRCATDCRRDLSRIIEASASRREPDHRIEQRAAPSASRHLPLRSDQSVG